MINIGVIGCGPWGMNIIRVLNELQVLTAICDTDIYKFHSMQLLGVPLQYYEDYHDMIDSPEIDAVVVATPAETHYKIARDVLLAGKDVFVEKPLTLNSKHAEELVAIAQGSILMVGHIVLYHPMLQQIVSNLDELGKVTHIFSTRLSWGRFRDTESCWQSFAPHDVSVITHILDKLPTAYRVHGDNNYTQTLLEFDEGEQAYIQVSWLYPTKVHRLAVVGDKGKVEFDGASPIIPEPLKEEMRHFISCVDTRKKPLTDGKHGLDVVRVLERCNNLLKRQDEEVP